MSIDISYNNSINCFNLLYYIITTTSFTVSFTLVNVFMFFQYICLSSIVVYILYPVVAQKTLPGSIGIVLALMKP